MPSEGLSDGIGVQLAPNGAAGAGNRFFTLERYTEFNCEFQRCLRLEYAKSYTYNNVICDWKQKFCIKI